MPGRFERPSAGHQPAPRARGSALESRIQWMQGIPLFRGVCRDQMLALAAGAYERRVGRRGFFYREAEPALEACVLCTGRVKMTQLSAGGQEVILRLVGPGELLGGVGVSIGGCFPASAEALDESHALCWERQHLEQVLEACPPLQRNALRILGERLRMMEERYRELATERVAQRLSHTLLRLLGQLGRPSEGGVRVALSREDLAQMMGTTIFTVSRLLSDWEAKGILRARREAVVIDDPRRLIELAEATETAELHKA